MWKTSPANTCGRRTWRRSNGWRMPNSRSSARNKALFGPVQSPCHGETMAFLSCLRRNASVKSIIQSTLTGPGAFCQRKWEFNQEKLPLCQQDYGSKRRDKGCMYCLLCGSREGLKSDRGLGSGLLKTYSWFCHWQVLGLYESHFRVLPQFCHMQNGGKLTYLTACCEAKLTTISSLRASSSWEGRC